ncbi:probable serine/threonine-protein kinase At1g54610 [Magnolia sinica]|uniref:probable serine/threonine-protein kinase At1g54610 n=1 Tax=Magnolia sinica TaxID=86752 RepID=UPI0026585ED6|nr:probable serine/threonine-protein kinase At1g54610 [Magnolia sinica]XP_058097639.1 probable serine/threonine-protein kinase At1g54610 [Magnolia sinica]
MGCICSKGGTADEFVGSRREKVLGKSSRRLSAPSRREEVVVEADGSNRNDGTVRLISKSQENVGLTPLSSDEGEKNAAVIERLRKTSHQLRTATDTVTNEVEPNLRITTVPNGVQGEQVAAGWPSWLTAVAGEAIKGWVPRRADSFEKLDKIGQGTYSNVYKARDLETGKIVALKKVRFVNMDPESVRFMAREIHVLRRLDHPNVVKLEGLIAPRMSNSLYLVFEYMEHDLAGLAATPGLKFTEPQIKCYMQQLLRGLEHCHSRGVLHRDIKGSNLLIDNNGILRIADFGLATFFHPDQKQPLTSRVVTLWYRPPELLLGATEYGVAVDLWSTGCILAELLAGKPIMPGRTEVEQLHKIFKLCGSPSEDYWRTSKLPHATIFKPQHPYKRCVAEMFKDFAPSALALMDVLLAIEPAHRGTAASALKSKFFTTQPLACDPSSLPKYPPSKEFDAKLREEEARRQRTASVKEHGSESIRKEPRESKAIPAPDANAELQSSLQKRQTQSNHKSSSEKFNPQEDCGSGFSIHPPSGTSQNGFSHSGRFLQPGTFGSLWKKKAKDDEILTAPGQAFSSSRASNGSDSKTQGSYMPQGAPNLSNLSGLVAARSTNHRERSTHPHWPEQRSNGRCNQMDDAEASGKQEWTHHLLDRASSSHKKGERTSGKESTVGYGGKKNRIHYSGPLLPPSGNLDEMLKEHERQIQQAVRKARHDKTKPKKSHAEKTQFEALLYPGRNGGTDV